MRKYILIAGCLLWGMTGYGQEKVWSLRECIEFAVENNVEIKQQELQVKSAEVDLSTSKNSRLPNLNASLDHTFKYGRNQITQISQDGQGVQSGSYVTTNAGNTYFSVGSETPVFTGFKIPNQVKQDRFSLKASIEGLQKAKENLELQITSYYLEILFKKEILKMYQEQAALTEQQVARTSVLVETGKVATSQLYDIRAQLASDQVNVTNAKNDLDISLLNLAQALNLRVATNFDIVEPDLSETRISEQESLGLKTPDEVYQTAINIKPHVKEASYRVESSKYAIKVAQSGYWPTISFGLGYETSFQRLYNSSNPSFKDQFDNNANKYIQFSMSIPIFNRFQVRNNVRKARLEMQNQEYNLVNVKLNLYKEIQQAYQNAVAAQAKYMSTEKAYDASAESFKYAEERYRIGKSTVFEYNEAQTKLLNSRSEQIQAKYDFVFRNKILDFYYGRPIDNI